MGLTWTVIPGRGCWVESEITWRNTPAPSTCTSQTVEGELLVDVVVRFVDWSVKNRTPAAATTMTATTPRATGMTPIPL